MNGIMLDQHYRHLQHLEAAINTCALRITMHASGTVITANSQVEAVLQQPFDILTGKQLTAILVPVDAAQWQQIWLTLLKGNAVQEQVCFSLPGNISLWLETIISPIMDEEGKLLQCILIGLDITARKLTDITSYQNDLLYSQVLKNVSQDPHLQEGRIVLFMHGISDNRTMRQELQKANEQLAYVNKSLLKQHKQLEDFAHITSHHLRAPIANLKALMQMYNEALVQQEKDLYLGMLHEMIKKMDETLNELIEVVQIRKDLHIKKENLVFAERLQQVKDVLFADITTSKIRITANFEREPVITYPSIYLDSIIQNIISNAIRFRSPERLPMLHLTTQKQQDSIVLIAEDNGIGIDMERFGNKLFGFRKTFHKNKEAKGIGLFITKTQVEAMGGSIRAESKPGKGTKFIITFKSD